MTLEELIAYINEAKTIVANSPYHIPVSSADVWPILESIAGPPLVRAMDFVCMNMQPFWEGWDIICPADVDYVCASAGDYVHRKAAGLEGYFGKPVWVCESGWPTEGERCCEGREFARDGLRVSFAMHLGMMSTRFYASRLDRMFPTQRCSLTSWCNMAGMPIARLMFMLFLTKSGNAFGRHVERAKA